MLTGSEISKQRGLGNITIEPFNEDRVNPNSYNVSISDEISIVDMYENRGYLDMKKKPILTKKLIGKEGFLLLPNTFYIVHTIEKVGSEKYIPLLIGRSSTARLGISVHQTAGLGDIGFYDQWVMTLSALVPVKIYANTAIAQIVFFSAVGLSKAMYNGKYHSNNSAESKFFEEL